MKTFEIRYYDSDGGGINILLTKVEFFVGTIEEAAAFVEKQRSLWGFNYTPATQPYQHGTAVITEVHHLIPKLEEELLLLEERIKILRKAGPQ